MRNKTKPMSKQLTRRKFIKSAAVTGVASTLGMPAIVRAQNQNSKLQVGFVATGGRAGAHVGFSWGARNKYGLHCVAFAEIDKNSWKNVHRNNEWKDAKGYTDWRCSTPMRLWKSSPHHSR